jgi:hypothetical protein
MLSTKCCTLLHTQTIKPRYIAEAKKKESTPAKKPATKKTAAKKSSIAENKLKKPD